MADDIAFLKTSLNPFGPRKASNASLIKVPSYGSFNTNNEEEEEDEVHSGIYQSSRLSEEDDPESVSTRLPPRVSLMDNVSDFANVFKAFIGTNYLQMPFAFSQAGLVAGSIGIIIVAMLTDHCCNLIVRCKKACVYSLIESSSSRYLTTSTSTTATLQAQHPQAMERLEEKAEKAISYPDIGRFACGRWAQNLCSIALLLTEFGFALNYFVFVGNTINALIQSASPLPPPTLTPNSTQFTFPTITTTMEVPTTTNLFPNNSSTTESSSHLADFVASTTGSSMFSSNSSSTPFPSVSPADTNDITPLYLILIAAQIPIQIGFSLLKDMRSLGPFSTVSNFAILIGYVALLSFFYVGFEEMSDAKLAQWSSLPMFFAATTSNYEGIGTIVPIESSMSGNRHRYPKYLHVALMLVTFLLAFFGLSGYTRYGSAVNQVITVTVSQYCSSNQLIIVQIVNVTLCIGIILTYPLHMFVIVETLEPLVFGSSKPSCRSPTTTRSLSCRTSHRELVLSTDARSSNASRTKRGSESSKYSPDDGIEDLDNGLDDLIESFDRELETMQSSGDTEELLDEDSNRINEGVGEDLSISVPNAVPDGIPRWKRNAFRIFMVCLTAISAMFLKNYFFYVSALTGSLGSVLLAYVLPCYFHIKLCPNEMTNWVFGKNVAIMAFGVAAGVAGLYSVIDNFM